VQTGSLEEEKDPIPASSLSKGLTQQKPQNLHSNRIP